MVQTLTNYNEILGFAHNIFCDYNYKYSEFMENKKLIMR